CGKVVGLSHLARSQPEYADHGNDHHLLHSEYRTIVVPAGLFNLSHQACSKSSVAKSNEKAEDKGDDGVNAELRRGKKPSQEDRAHEVESLDYSLSKPQCEGAVKRLPGHRFRTPLLRLILSTTCIDFAPGWQQKAFLCTAAPGNVHAFSR